MAMHRSNFRHEPRAGSSSIPLIISNAKIHGRRLTPRTVGQSTFSLAKLNHDRPEVNTVTPAALRHIIDDPSKLSTHQDIEIGWRREENGTLFTTLHRVVPGPIDSDGHGISFTGDLEWTRPISDLVSRFDQFAEQQEASIPRSFYQQNYVAPPSRREWGITTQGFASGAVGGATTPEWRRLQASQRLVAARQQYAHDEYLETGNTREVLRAMEQTQAVAAAALQLQQQEHEKADDDWWEV